MNSTELDYRAINVFVYIMLAMRSLCDALRRLRHQHAAASKTCRFVVAIDNARTSSSPTTNELQRQQHAAAEFQGRDSWSLFNQNLPIIFAEIYLCETRHRSTSMLPTMQPGDCVVLPWLLGPPNSIRDGRAGCSVYRPATPGGMVPVRQFTA